MIEAFIRGAISALIISTWVLFFKKLKKKRHVQIQMGILIGIASCLFLIIITGLIVAFTDDFGIGIFICLACGAFEFFILRKIQEDYKQIKEDKFEAPKDFFSNNENSNSKKS